MDALLQFPDFAQVWVMPSGDRVDKQIGTSDRHRLAMLRLIKKARFNDNPRLILTDFELKLPRPSATFTTLKELEKANPFSGFWFALGTDSYLSLPSWPHGKELKAKLKLVLLSSGGPRVRASKNVVRLDIPHIFGDTSSTQARRLTSEGADVSKVVSPPISRYIQKNHLYR